MKPKGTERLYGIGDTWLVMEFLLLSAKGFSWWNLHACGFRMTWIAQARHVKFLMLWHEKGQVWMLREHGACLVSGTVQLDLAFN